MSVLVIEQYSVADPISFPVGPINSASPWRILSVLVTGTGTVELNTGVTPYVFKVIDGTYTDERVLPSSDIPFPITMGNVKAVCNVTAPANFGIRIVFEDGIG